MLRQHCENPACEESVEVEQTDVQPEGWWLLSRLDEPPEGGGEQTVSASYLLCSLACVGAVAEIFDDAPPAPEEEEPDA